VPFLLFSTGFGESIPKLAFRQLLFWRLSTVFTSDNI